MASTVIVPSICALAIKALAVKQPQSQRQIYLLPMFTMAFIAWWNVLDLTDNAEYASIASFAITIWTESTIHALYISKHEIRTDHTTWERGFYALINPRCIDTEDNAERIRYWNRDLKPSPLSSLASKPVLQSPTASMTDSTSTTTGTTVNDNVKRLQIKSVSRQRFTIRRLGSLLLKYLMSIIFHEIIDIPSRLQITRADIAPEKRIFIRRLMTHLTTHDLTATTTTMTARNMNISRESSIRIFTVVSAILSDYLCFTGLHDTCAIVFVGILGFHSAEDWPPLWGRLSSVTNLRTWYSQFWHLLIYRHSVGYAVWILEDVLGVDLGGRSSRGEEKKKEMISGQSHVADRSKQQKARSRMGQEWKRLAIGALVCLQSGINHLVFAYPAFGELNWPGFWWWTSQFILLTLEDVMRTASMKLWPGLRRERYTSLRRWVGRLWVFAVLFWGTPKWALGAYHSVID